MAVVCNWGGDLSLGPNGDLRVASIQVEIKQRIVRRLLTSPGAYIWHTGYGAGMGAYVGEPYSPGAIELAILNQMKHEPLVEADPLPTVEVNPAPAGSYSTTSVTIVYNISDTTIGDSVVVGLEA